MNSRLAVLVSGALLSGSLIAAPIKNSSDFANAIMRGEFSLVCQSRWDVLVSATVQRGPGCLDYLYTYKTSLFTHLKSALISGHSAMPYRWGEKRGGCSISRDLGLLSCTTLESGLLVNLNSYNEKIGNVSGTLRDGLVPHLVSCWLR